MKPVCFHSSPCGRRRSARSLQADLLASKATFSTSRLFVAPGAGLESQVDISTAPVTTTTGAVYEAVMPDIQTLIGFGIVVLLSILAAWVWAEKVVPVSRTNLAISKSRGQVKEYLDELKATAPSSQSNQTSADLLIVSSDAEDKTTLDEPGSAPIRQDSRAFERWLFTDWLQDNKSARKAGRQKEAALPVLKDAKWNSGDNPVLVASALIGAGVLFSAVTERVMSAQP